MRKKLKILLIILPAFQAYLAFGQTTYYVKNGGNDALAGTSDATAWATIAKVNSFQSSLVAGDIVKFNRGDEWLGTITIGKTGTSGNRITYTSYGTGDEPRITGLETITGWTSQGDTIYYKAVSVESNPNYIIIGGKWYAMGRTPNQGSFLTYESYISNTSITDNDLPDSPSWVGSELVIRLTEYKTKRNYAITAHSAGKLTYAGGGESVSKPNYGYFFQGDIKTLDQFGEWYYNGTTLYVHFGSEDPDDYTVEVPVIDNGIYNVTPDKVNYYRHITIDSLSLYGFGRDAIYYQRYTDYAEIKNCSIEFSGYNAINVDTIGLRYGLIDNNYIRYAGHSGISVQSGVQCIITNNTIINTAPWLGIPVNFHRSAGIYSVANNNSLIQYNRIDSSGYNGILMSGNDALVKNNFITNSVLQVHDGAGIYTSGRTYSGRQIIGNIVLNSIGTTAGTSTPASPWVRGIYIDSDPVPIIVSDNTISNGSANGDYGMFLGSGDELIITNNTIIDNKLGAFRIQDYYGIDAMGHPTNHVMKYNKFIAKSTLETTLNMHMTTSAFTGSFATADSNYFARPINEGSTISRGVFSTSTNTYPSGTWTLPQWFSTYGLEEHSQPSPITVGTTADFYFWYNPTQSDSIIALDTTYVDRTCKFYEEADTLGAYESRVLLRTEDRNPPDVPDVSSTGLTRKTRKTITISGNVTDEGGGIVSARGVCFSVVGSPSIADSVIMSGSGTGTFTAKIIDLSASTTYYFRTYATNQAGTNYGEMYELRTPAYNFFKSGTKIIFHEDKIITY